MNFPTLTSRSTRAITRAEVLVMVVVVIFFAVVVMTMMVSFHGAQSEVHCVRNLGWIASSFASFANDHDGHHPFTATNSLAYTNETQAWLHFQDAKTYLHSAENLVCPEDTRRFTNAAADFNTGAVASASSLWKKTNAAVSYFVSLDANRHTSDAILAGDRHVARGWSGRGPIVTLASTNFPAWTTPHGRSNGIVVLVDHSTTEVSPSASRTPPVSYSMPTNRLLMPLPPF